MDGMKICYNCHKEVNYIKTKKAVKAVGFPVLGGLCGVCQSEKAQRLVKEFSPTVALWMMCMITDLPYIFKAIPNIATSTNVWEDYINKCLLTQPEALEQNFFDGETDFYRIYGIEMTLEEMEQVAELETKTASKKIVHGTKKQREKWSQGEAKKYESSDYDTLEEYYTAYATDAGGEDNLSETQKLAIKQCSYWALESDKAFLKGNTNAMKTYREQISKLRTDEKLNRKDIMPTEDFRIDDVTKALEAHGIIRGKELRICSHKELLDIFMEHMGVTEKPKHRYPYTIDAADHILLSIVNAMRINSGDGELSTLPKSLKLPNRFEAEFADEPNERERTVYKELGLARKRKPSKKNETEEK